MPNLDLVGEGLSLWEFAGDLGRFGYYLRQEPGGGISFRGQYAEIFHIGSFQELHPDALWAPALAFEAELFEDQWLYEGYVPLGSEIIAYVGGSELRVYLEVLSGPLVTPAGPFGDVLVMTRESSWEDSDGTSGVDIDELIELWMVTHGFCINPCKVRR